MPSISWIRAFRKVGFGSFRNSAAPLPYSAVLDVLRGLDLAVPATWSLFPPDGATVPQPMPEWCPGRACSVTSLRSVCGYELPVGLPALIRIASSPGPLVLESSSLTESSTQLAHCLVDPETRQRIETGVSPAGRPRYVAVIPRAPLTVGKTYTLAAVVDGTRLEATFTIAGEATCGRAPDPPTGLASAVAGVNVTLSWTRSAGCAPTTYVLEAGSGPGLANLVALSLHATAATFSTPAPAGTCFVRVRARNAFGVSAPSNEVVVVVP